MRYIFLVFMFLIANLLFGQKMFWNDMTEKDKKDALNLAELFQSRYEQSDFEGIGELFIDQGIFIGKNRWLEKQSFIEELRKIKKNISLPYQTTTAYTFDEFLDNHLSNDLIQKTWEVFDNHSVLVPMHDINGDPSGDCILVIRKSRDTSWLITGVVGIIPANGVNISIDKNDFRLEKIANAGIQLPIPKDFTGPAEINNQNMFFYEGNSGRDAVFQIMTDQISGRIYFYTFKFVEHNNQQFKLSNLMVRYVPAGIMYEYEVIDSDGLKNKGITVGIENGNKAVLIQFYAFMDVYMKMQKRVGYSLANIKL